MKRTTLLFLLAAAMSVAICKTAAATTPLAIHERVATDSLAIFTGKYQREIHNDIFYIQIDVIDGELTGTTLWDGNKILLKHLSGNNFMVSGLDWGVKFVRDKTGTVTEVVIRGTDRWTKVKN